MLIDIHVHTAKHSPCSTIALPLAVSRAREVGLDAICITDHDTDGVRQEAELISREAGFKIFVGMEILTYEGDLLVFGLSEVPRGKLHAVELIETLSACGGIAVAAHPYRDNGRGLGDMTWQLPGLAGVEVFNGRTEEADNQRAAAHAAACNLPCLGGSDAHRLDEIGRYVTYVPGRLDRVEQFVQAVMDKRVRPHRLRDQGKIKKMTG